MKERKKELIVRLRESLQMRVQKRESERFQVSELEHFWH